MTISPLISEDGV
ncbi:hypothetical protein POVCU1_026390, partial [Plasmodium ovale curtisi]